MHFQDFCWDMFMVNHPVHFHQGTHHQTTAVAFSDNGGTRYSHFVCLWEVEQQVPINFIWHSRIHAVGKR